MLMLKEKVMDSMLFLDVSASLCPGVSLISQRFMRW